MGKSATAIQSIIEWLYTKTLQCDEIASTSIIDDSHIKTSANISPLKLGMAEPMQYKQGKLADTVVADAGTALGHIWGTSGLSNYEGKFGVHGAITGADRTITIDIKKQSGTSILVTPLVLTNITGTALAMNALSIDPAITITNGDYLYVTVAVAGSASAQGTGLHGYLRVKQNPV